MMRNTYAIGKITLKFPQKCTSTDSVIKSLFKPGSREKIQGKLQTNRVVNTVSMWIATLKFYPTNYKNIEGC